MSSLYGSKFKTLKPSNGESNGVDIRITCKSHTVVPISEIVWFQGNLAELTEDAGQRLTNSIRKHGIFLPLSIWESEGQKFCVDGHARLHVLREVLHYTGDVPINYVLAESYADAKEKVLLARSQSNVTTMEGLYEFQADVDLDWQIMPELLDIPQINIESLQKQHPDIVRITRKWNRWQHHVDYRPFKKNKLIRKKDISIKQGVDNFGMKLVNVGLNEWQRSSTTESL